jgi:hypothetical protein
LAADSADEPADGRPEHEPRAERRADDAEVLGAILRPRNIGDVRHCRHVHRTRHAGHRAAKKEPPDRRREGRHQIVQPVRHERQQDNGPAAEPVAQVAHHRSEEELQTRVGHQQPSKDRRRVRVVLARQRADEIGQHGNHDAESHRVDQDGEEDEQERPPGNRRRALQLCHLCHQWLICVICG